MSEVMVAFRRTAARVTPGAISLSSSSHLPLKLYSNWRKPVTLPTRPRQTTHVAGADWIGDIHEHDRYAARRPHDTCLHKPLGAENAAIPRLDVLSLRLHRL